MNNNIATSKSDEIRKIKEGAEKVYEDKQWIIIIPHTKEASCYYGKNTQWCTAADKSNNQFDYYNQQGPLFINIDKINNTKYQFHFETNSFMNEHDEPINYPIEHNCDLSEGALKWYQNNVEQAYKLTNIKYELFWNEYMPYSLVGQNNDIGFKLLEGDDDDYENEIAYGLICHGQSEANYLQTSLNKYDYCLINNIWNRKTLILKSNNGELFTYGSHIKNVTTVKNMYSDDDMTLLMVTDDENTLEIIYNNGYSIYKNTNANLIQDAEYLTYDSLKINKTNDLCDVVLINTETPYIDLKDAYQNDEDMAEDTIHIVYTNGNKIKINTYNGEEIIE